MGGELVGNGDKANKNKDVASQLIALAGKITSCFGTM
jgi:hypothetical protein